MRRTPVVAAAALIAAVALAGLPAPAGSISTSGHRAVEPAAFTALTIPATDTQLAPAASGVADPARRSEGYLAPGDALAEPGSSPVIKATRPRVNQPAASGGRDWKPPKYTISGYATFYDNGTTAMRLPRGTVVRICGDGGCIERTVTDYGPVKPSRIVDLYRPDFFAICGCEWFAGTTRVTVSVY